MAGAWVWTRLGVLTTELFLERVPEPPEQPRYLQVREAFSRRVSLSWLPPDGRRNDPVVAYIVQYKEASRTSTFFFTEFT